MADIESMYLQCRVPVLDQSSLKFLWFDRGDPNHEIVDLQMMSQAFAITSSRGNAGLLLRECWFTVEENRTGASGSMVETLVKNVYVKLSTTF